MNAEISLERYVKTQWATLQKEVTSEKKAFIWTIYDVALKALAYLSWGFPLIGAPLFLTLFVVSIGIDVAIAKKWPKYLAALRKYFQGEIQPAMQRASSQIGSSFARGLFSAAAGLIG